MSNNIPSQWLINNTNFPSSNGSIVGQVLTINSIGINNTENLTFTFAGGATVNATVIETQIGNTKSVFLPIISSSTGTRTGSITATLANSAFFSPSSTCGFCRAIDGGSISTPGSGTVVLNSSGTITISKDPGGDGFTGGSCQTGTADTTLISWSV